MAKDLIDPEKLRVAIRWMTPRRTMHMLEDAVDLLPPAKLLALVKRHLDPAGLRPDSSLLAGVKAFEKASLAGKYYESFKVNAENYREQSSGTRAWIAECERLFDRCAAHVSKLDPAEVCESFDIMFGLLRRIDEYADDIVFFADEGGSWQVNVNWEEVLPAWFTCLSATAAPEEFARRVVMAIEKYPSAGQAKLLASARRIATPAQRKALQAVLPKGVPEDRDR